MNRWQKMRIEDVTYGKQKRVLHILSLIGRYTILVLMALFFMFPVVYMVVVSFQNNMAAVAPQHIIPHLEDFALDGYKDFFSRASFFKGIGNTLIVCVLCIGGILTGATFCAYGLTKVYFKGQKVMFLIILATVFLPGTVTSIPLYTIYQKIGNGSELPSWEGYNFILNRNALTKGEGKTKLETIKTDGEFDFGEEAKECDYYLDGKTLSIAIPLSFLGIKEGKEFTIDFKVTDGISDPSNMMNYYVDGDSAPIGRLNYRYNSEHY